MVPCYNRGCGKDFDPEKNDDDSCLHHPGVPFFHDAYKGWTCCNKKSVDFTEFLNIKGCTLSKHSNIKPPQPEKPKQEENDVQEEEEEEVAPVREPVKVAMPRPPIDSPLVPVKTTVAPALKNAIDELKGKVTAVQGAQLGPGEISIGTSCKNKGCTCSYTGTSSDDCECQYHPGVPIFHEGLKYWSCCQKKTTDFTTFMAQKGCAYGQHKWVKEDDDKKSVECRYDWHQTARDVIVSIYAKMYHYEQSRIEVNPIRLHVNLVFPEQNNATYDLDLELRGIIDVSKTTANMFASKVEITMPKAEPGSWQKLHFPQATQLPVAKKQNPKIANVKENKDSDSEEFDLDDIETINSGVRLTDLAGGNINDLD